jgi:hypothetical protein
MYNEYKSRLLPFNKCKSIENRQLLHVCQAKNIQENWIKIQASIQKNARQYDKFLKKKEPRRIPLDIQNEKDQTYT